MEREVLSAANRQIKNIAKLNQKKYRDEAGKFLIEGEKLIYEAAKSGLKILSVYIDKNKLDKFDRLVKLLTEKNIRIFIAEDSAIKKVSDTVTPQGIVAVTLKPTAQNMAEIKGNGKYIALEGLQDPGNVGTIIRASEACGIDGVILCSNCADIYSPKVIRAGMGSSFRVPCYFTDSMTNTVNELKALGMTVYAAAASAGGISVCSAFDSGAGYAVVIGNEGNGVCNDTIKLCSNTVYIPMKGDIESFNAALAAAIIMWEMCKH